MNNELRIKIDITIPLPENPFDMAAAINMWGAARDGLIARVEALGGHLHMKETMAAARKRKEAAVFTENQQNKAASAARDATLPTADDVRGILADPAVPYVMAKVGVSEGFAFTSTEPADPEAAAVDALGAPIPPPADLNYIPPKLKGIGES